MYGLDIYVYGEYIHVCIYVFGLPKRENKLAGVKREFETCAKKDMCIGGESLMCNEYTT